MFKLKIETDNAAFDEGAKEEILRILHDAIDLIERGHREHTLHDINGNNVGNFCYTLGKKVKK